MSTEVGVVPLGADYRKVLRYAAVHEYGTVGADGKLPDLRPRKKPGGFLFIPVGSALSPTGQAKYSGQDLLKGRVPGIRYTFVRPSRKDPENTLVVLAIPGTASKGGRRRRGKGKLRRSRSDRIDQKKKARQRERKKKKIAGIEVVAVLKRTVAIKARPYIKPERPRIVQKISRRLDQLMTSVLK